MDESINKDLDRRNFLKTAGIGAIGATAVIAGCKPKRKEAALTSGAPNPSIGEMTYRTSKSGDKLSMLAYGCMRLPQRKKIGGAENETEIDQEYVNSLIDFAIEKGVNYFDTSPAYCKGMSEDAVGKALSRYPRDKYFVATKLSNFASPDREDSMKIYRDSFEKLKVDYIDYYLLHALGDYETFKARYVDNGMLDFLISERKAGKIRNLGWSFHGKKEFFDYMMFESGIDWDFTMVQLNYFDWENVQGWSDVNSRYLYETLEKLKVPVMIMEPLLGGRLARPNHKAQVFMKQSDPDASFASWAFRFAGSLPGVITVLSGMTFKEHLQDSLHTFAPFTLLNDDERKMLVSVSETMLEYKSITCTACNYCMPCPYGIDIPGVFSHYNRCMEEGNFPDTPSSEIYKQARRAFLVSMDRSVEKLRQASHCIGCGKCLAKCPQRVRITQEMEKIDKFVENLRTDEMPKKEKISNDANGKKG